MTRRRRNQIEVLWPWFLGAAVVGIGAIVVVSVASAKPALSATPSQFAWVQNLGGWQQSQWNPTTRRYDPYIGPGFPSSAPYMTSSGQPTTGPAPQTLVVVAGAPPVPGLSTTPLTPAQVALAQGIASSVQAAQAANAQAFSQTFAAIVGSMLQSGSTLTAGQSIKSLNGHFTLTMGIDGNLRLTNASGATLWSTSVTPGESYGGAIMQSNGDLVIYYASDTLTGGNATGGGWDSGTATAGSYLIVQNDGNVVMYSQPNAVGPIWATGTGGGQVASMSGAGGAVTPYSNPAV